MSFMLVGSRTLSAETQLLNRLLNNTEYDFAVRPPGVLNEDDPCVVEIDLVLNSVGPVSSLDMEMTISFYLRQEWVDPRLRFSDPDLINKTIDVSHIYLAKLWIPDLFFTMGKESHRHELTTPNLLIRLQADGTILYSQRITSTMKCYMDLSNFPHDRQRCMASMMSYSYTTDDVIFRTSSKRAATSVLPSAFLAEFTLSDVTVEDCTETFATGTFTCLQAILFLEREMGFYLTQSYIPSILIVMLSWAAFWIDHEAVPARISVGLLTVLTITTQSTGARSQLPRVSYVKAIDVWMSMNLIFVFAAYMEYAFVTVMSRRYKRILRNQNNSETSSQRTESESGEGDISNSNISLPVTLYQPGDIKQSISSDLNHLHQQQPPSPLPQQQQQQQQQKRQQQPQMYQPEPASLANGDSKKRNRRRRRFSFLQRQKNRLFFKRNFGRRVDFHSRYIFPVSYVIFNIAYWLAYLLPW